MSLYQKYRPQEFESLSGQQHVKKSLQAALEKNLVSHAYLFCGPRGTGKTTTARLLAKSLNCPDFNSTTLEPCNKCSICESITNSGLIDVIEIDAASNRGIDEIRELKETIRFAPTIAKNKIYIIDEVHMLTNEAFNALLKTLEEPPGNVFFVLATTEVHKIPETILSRCQRFDFRRINNSDLIDRLKFIVEAEKLEFELEALEMISIYSEGGLRDAISILDQLSVTGSVKVEETKRLLGSTGIDTIYKFIESLFSGNDQAATAIIEDLHKEGFEIKQFQTDVLKICREKLHIAIEKNDLSEKSKLVELISLWQEIVTNFKNSPIPELGLEVLVVKFCNKLTRSNYVDQPLRPNVSERAPEPVHTPLKASTHTTVAPMTPPKAEIKIDIQKPKNDLQEIPTETAPDKPKGVKLEPVQDESTPTVVKEKIKLDVDIESDWKKLAENISAPALRLTLKNTKCKVVSDSDLEVLVSSNFDYERIKKAESIHLIEKMILDITGLSLTVKIVKELVDINTIREQATIKEAENNAKAKAGPAVPVSFNEIGFNDGEPDPFDMFEGEFIDD